MLYAAGVMPNPLRTLLSEPRIKNPPVRVRRDWTLLAAMVVLSIVEAVLRTDLPWPLLQVLFTVGRSLTLLWRRTHPFLMIALAVGATGIYELVAVSLDQPGDGLYTGAFILILPYALVRWGPGRQMVPGIVLMLSIAVLALATGSSDWGEMIGGIVFMMFPAELGAAVRYQETSRARRADQIRSHEREQLARELHDTVAHHVSAIAIQAQAGRAVAATNPEAAIDALHAIETEATRSLAEMRAMVGVLRSEEKAELTPQKGMADIAQLADPNGQTLQVNVDLSGDLDDLRPSVSSAVYRLVQESITNARRHARNASAVEVRVVGDSDRIRLTVEDDGSNETISDGSDHGFGIEGMAERTKLLGGTFHAGPRQDRGWTVDAVLPKTGVRQ